MTKKIHYEGDIEITIPDEVVEEILPAFKEYLDSNANEEDVFIHVAHNIIYCGCNDFVEGVGTDFEYDFEKPDLDIME